MMISKESFVDIMSQMWRLHSLRDEYSERFMSAASCGDIKRMEEIRGQVLILVYLINFCEVMLYCLTAPDTPLSPAQKKTACLKREKWVDDYLKAPGYGSYCRCFCGIT
jgi:hypothetical protein